MVQPGTATRDAASLRVIADADFPRLTRAAVHLDGEPVGRLGRRHPLELDLAPGSRELAVELVNVWKVAMPIHTPRGSRSAFRASRSGLRLDRFSWVIQDTAAGGYAFEHESGRHLVVAWAWQQTDEGASTGIPRWRALAEVAEDELDGVLASACGPDHSDAAAERALLSPDRRWTMLTTTPTESELLALLDDVGRRMREADVPPGWYQDPFVPDHEREWLGDRWDTVSRWYHDGRLPPWPPDRPSVP